MSMIPQSLNARSLRGAPGGTARALERHARTFKNARRDLNGVSAALERRVLTWLAERTPARINSDHLTVLGALAMLLAGASYALARWNRAGFMLATLFLALNWLGDSLDGTLARVRNLERPRYGFYVDHMLDAFGTTFLMGGLALSGYLDWRVAVGMLVGFLMLAIEVYLSTYTLGVFRLSFWKFGPTEVRVLLAVANVTLWLKPGTKVARTPFRLLDFGGCVAIAGMAVMLVVATTLHIVRLYREETLP